MMQAVEWETMRRVDGYTSTRRSGPIGYIPSPEAERLYLEQIRTMERGA